MSGVDLGQAAEELLAEKGYIPRTDPVGDAAALALWNARFDELAANPPTKAELLARIEDVLAHPRPHPLWSWPWEGPEPRPVIPGADPDTGEADAWMRPQDLIVTTHTAFPYHHSPAGLAELCVRTAQDRDDAEELAKGLIVQQVRRPGGSAFWVETNGNHRALSFHALGLPLVPARVEPNGNWWEIHPRSEHRRPTFAMTWPWVEHWFAWQLHPSLLELLQADGLIREHRQDDPPWGNVLFYSEDVAPWIAHPNPARIPALLKAYEAKFGTLEDPRYDWLRTRTSIRRRLWAHAWPEIREQLRTDLPRLLRTSPTLAAATELAIGFVLLAVVWLLVTWWLG